MARTFSFLLSLFLLIGCATPVKLEPLEPVPADHPASPQAPEASVPNPSLILRPESQDMTRTDSPGSGMGEMDHPVHGMSDEGSAAGGQTSFHVYTCTMHPEVIETKLGACSKCGTSLIAATAFTCTMDPEVIRTKPGTCPKCGMTLVKKESLE